MSTGAEVLAAVRELHGPGITQAQIAATAGCSQSQVSLAVRLLVHAPELADAVSAGTIGLARGGDGVAAQESATASPPEGAGSRGRRCT